MPEAKGGWILDCSEQDTMHERFENEARRGRAKRDGEGGALDDSEGFPGSDTSLRDPKPEEVPAEDSEEIRRLHEEIMRRGPQKSEASNG